MKICDVVKTSVWCDPRVKKQIVSYKDAADCEVVAVGIEDTRYNADEVAKVPCEVKIVRVDKKYFSAKRTFFTKLERELRVNREMTRMIIESKPDVIHANDLNALIPAYKAAKKLRCKLVYDSHEVFVENLGIVNHKLIKMIWAFQEKRLVRKIDLMVCVSNAAAEYFAKKYRIKKPMVVTNCISAARLITGEVEKATPRQILNHGQFYAGRGYDIMIEASAALKEKKDLQFVLRGYGVMEPQLRTRAEEMKAENVYFAPPVKVEELIPEASRAWVGLAITEAISLNFKLSVSNKIFEYAAAGLPVIMSDIPEHRFLNGKYNFGIILEKDTPEELAKAINRLDEDKQLYETCARNARKMSVEVNWDEQIGMLMETMRAMIS